MLFNPHRAESIREGAGFKGIGGVGKGSVGVVAQYGSEGGSGRGKDGRED